MARYGYSFVTDKGFSAFAADLDDGPWKKVSIKNYDTEDRIPADSLFKATRPIVWKLRLHWAIEDLDSARGASPELVKQLDNEWDAAQRAIHLFLQLELESQDPAHRAAAERLRGALLEGAGTEQTKASYDAEVDYGLQQLSRARKPPLDADAKLIGLAPHLNRIEAATQALAKGLGRELGKKRVTPSKRYNDALSACTSTFNAVHDEMVWLLKHLPQGEEKELVEALLEPLVGLLERYPPPRSAKSAEQAEEQAPESDAEPATEEETGTEEKPD